MKSPKDAVLLRAFVSENDKSGGLPLYEAIVLKAREMHLDGATVLRGPIGFVAPGEFTPPRLCSWCMIYQSWSKSWTRRKRSMPSCQLSNN